MNDDEFFSSTPELQTIRQWAHSRYAASWAVFGAVLLRVSASTEPCVQLPGVIGGRASINLLAAFVSPSGGGKGISDKVARLVWPAPLIERPIGSGEGIAATFVPPKKEGIEPVTRAIISVPEVDTLAGLASRQGSILLAQLKSLAMGEQLGQSNASEATTRIIPAHSYRACLSVGAQPTHTGVLFDDTTGGTPQRFLWFLTIDPDMPADVIDDPEPLDTKMPMWSADGDGIVQIGYGPDEIRSTIISAHLARQRGESDALDGHAMLTRCKVAAVLAVLHKRSVVSELDWQLSGVVMERSNRTRDWVIAEGARAAKQKARDRALARAAGEEVIDDRRLDVVKRRIRTVLARGALSRSDVRRQMGKREYRDLFDAAVAEMVHEGAVTSADTDKGVRMELTPEFTGEPQFTPENSRSSGVTPEFTGEPVEAPHESDTALRAVPDAPSKLTCKEWTRTHALDLMATGIEKIDSGVWYAAGKSKGYKIDNLRRCVMESDLIATVANSGRGATFRLGAGGTSTVVSCPDWLAAWLSDHEWVRVADAYAAGAEAGYQPATVKSAALRLRVEKRGQSIHTEWRHRADTTTEEESA